MTAKKDTPARQDWVDIAKGLCILAVVGLWGARSLIASDGSASWLGYLSAFAQPFRMPDFFLISGLFLGRVIDRPWRDFADRRVLHYLHFLVLWAPILVVGQWLLGLQHPQGPADALAQLLLALWKPPAMLWFLLMLPVYALVSRALRGVPPWHVGLAAAVMHLFPLHTGVPVLDWFGEFFVFFHAGHRLAPFFLALARWTSERPRRALALLALWAPANAVLVHVQPAPWPLLALLLGMVGIGAVVMIAALLQTRRLGAGLQAAGRDSIVIYLGFWLPMQALAPLLAATGLPLALRALLLPAGAIAAALLLHRLARRHGAAWLYRRPPSMQLAGRSGADRNDAPPARAA
ncbi:acyltransferase family protein [Sphaerotilus uruguayifluvii]|uniref:Membrane protein YcfT n=1 Tax=Sphaerotilus uruguayifluvii TaxID=2735897 RepID=A0ABX2G3S1_9BURK|nr:acyltransferase family protein [Leptothrix sp. C29]NRT56079.1 putative membrane protein YcfT [Leptothrix sp. C29]